MRTLVIYNHGKDSIPWGEKPLALKAVAEKLGCRFVSPDYRPSNDPEQRVQQLLGLEFGDYDRLILIGSSMGGYVSVVASETLKPDGMFLIAPAFYLPGYARTEFAPVARQIEIYHGWQDDVVPPENAWRFAQLHRASLHLLDADHRLLSILPTMTTAFERFLQS